VGLSLLLIQYIGSQREAALTKTDESLSVHSEMTNPLYQYVFEQLSRLRELFLATRNGKDYDSDEDVDGESLVVHQGSCHCGSVAFEVTSFGSGITVGWGPSYSMASNVTSAFCCLFSTGVRSLGIEGRGILWKAQLP
jgi:hypothetical protein